MRQILILILLSLYLIPAQTQDILINEVMTSNAFTIADEDGEYNDWFELYNSSTEAVTLNGYWLSDDLANVQKWQFGDSELPAEGFMLVFASDKDRQVVQEYWNTIIDWGDEWRYVLPDDETDEDWREPGYDDSEWESGPTGIGYGDNDDQTEIEEHISLFARRTFDIEDLDVISEAVLHIDFDDAFVAFLNGEEFARENVGYHGEIPFWDAPAWDDGYEARMYQGFPPDRFDIEDFHDLAVEGENVLAIQIHNLGWDSSDMTFIPFLSLRQVGNTDLNPPPSILDLGFSYNHTNFKLQSSGEYLILADPFGQVLDSLFTGLISTDISRGRNPDGADNWVYYQIPTPGESNFPEGSDTLIVPVTPTFSDTSGFYTHSFYLKVTTSEDSVELRYTLDGSTPTVFSNEFPDSLLIHLNRVLRVRPFMPPYTAGQTITHTYFVNEPQNLPIFSIVGEPVDFFGPGGIYEGADDREIPVYVQLFEAGGEQAFGYAAGCEIFGSGSSGFEQKSLAIFFRGAYGLGELPYQLFPDLPFMEYESFLLRNGGNDWWSTLIRDPMASNGFMPDSEVDFQRYRPAVVYINGEYWGIHNLREKVNEHYIADHHFVPQDNLDFLEYKEVVTPLILHGDREHYNHMIEFMEDHDLGAYDDYQYIASMIDIDNMLDYQIIEIYTNNWDWPANNNRFWRARDEGGKWRWILYDLDTGFSLWDSDAWRLDHVWHAINTEGSLEEGWPNPPWSTFIFRNMLENQDFENAFVNRFADYLNTRFQPDRATAIIDSFHAGIELELPAHLDRWDRSQNDYNHELQKVYTFADQRPRYLWRHLKNNFDIGDTLRTTVGMEPAGTGIVKLNTLFIEEERWSGKYFTETPLLISAQPKPGYRFIEWQGIPGGEEATITPYPGDYPEIIALFAPDTAGGIVVNEVNYSSGDLLQPRDWFEIYNTGSETIDLSGWTFRDSADTNIYRFPVNFFLEGGSYLVVARDRNDFITAFPEVENVIGSFNFGLSATGDAVRLFDADTQLVDSVYFLPHTPWPTAANGFGPTLELINPISDNVIAQNWAASDGFGTPGRQNSRFDITHIFDPDTSYNPPPPDTTVTPEDTLPSIEYDRLIVYPNPFSELVNVRYRTVFRSKVGIRVYDLLGKEVAVLINEFQDGDEYEFVWRAIDSNGRKLPAGTYFVVLSQNSKAKANQKILRM